VKQARRLDLIADIYEHFAFMPAGNLMRDQRVAWDMCQIFGAIALDQKIVLSPYFKGVRLLRKNNALWKQIEQCVELRKGLGVFPGDDRSGHALAEYASRKGGK
jgi:hypothetical protein